MRRLLSEGQLPQIRKWLVEPGTFTEAVTCFPSTTGPAYLPFLTGRFPGHCNLPGIRWMDRKEYEERSWSSRRVRSYVGWESFLMNTDLLEGTTTLFDRLRGGVNVFSPISSRKGVGHERGRLSKALLFTYAHYTEHWEAVDSVARARFARAVDAGERFVFGAFMAVDELSHHIDSVDERVLRVYRQFDAFIGRICEGLNRSGRLDRSILGVISDHGMTPVNRHLELTTFCEEHGLKTFSYPRIYRHWRNAECAVMVSGNAMAHLYLRRGDSWGPAHAYDDLTPAQRKFLNALCGRDEVDFLALREAGGGVRVLNRDGHAKIRRSKSGISYAPVDADPLKFGKVAFGDDEEALHATVDSDYPDGLVQMEQIFSSARTGDVIVSARRGSDLRYRYEWPEHHSSHGSFIREHMMTPLILNIKVRPEPMRTADLYPTLLEALGEPVEKQLDGVSRLQTASK
ncbi:MAG: alkaline phosphatase family protein [Nitrospirae bacterium]|nr:alkaline phosphatase family protein [Nitrospirota bacterium]